MTIEEIQHKKNKLEGEIFKLIHDFNIETNVSVTDCSIDISDNWTIQGDRVVLLERVNIEVKL